MEIDVKVEGAVEFKEALKVVERMLPDKCLEFLELKAKDLEEDVMYEMSAQGIVRTGKLATSFEHDKPKKSLSGAHSVTVDSGERYAHLIEDGHELVGHKPTFRHLGYVKAYAPLQKTIDKLNMTYSADAEKYVRSVFDTLER